MPAVYQVVARRRRSVASSVGLKSDGRCSNSGDEQEWKWKPRWFQIKAR